MNWHHIQAQLTSILERGEGFVQLPALQGTACRNHCFDVVQYNPTTYWTPKFLNQNQSNYKERIQASREKFIKYLDRSPLMILSMFIRRYHEKHFQDVINYWPRTSFEIIASSLPFLTIMQEVCKCLLKKSKSIARLSDIVQRSCLKLSKYCIG